MVFLQTETSTPSNRRQVLYYPLFVFARPWDNIFVNFVGGFPTTRKGHDYLFVVVDRFKKMSILMPCKMTNTRQETKNMLF